MIRYWICRTEELTDYPWTFEAYDGSDRGTTATQADAIAAVYSKTYWSSTSLFK